MNARSLITVSAALFALRPLDVLNHYCDDDETTPCVSDARRNARAEHADRAITPLSSDGWRRTP